MAKQINIIVEDDGNVRFKSDGEFNIPEIVYLLERAKFIVMEERIDEPIKEVE